MNPLKYYLSPSVIVPTLFFAIPAFDYEADRSPVLAGAYVLAFATLCAWVNAKTAGERTSRTARIVFGLGMVFISIFASAFVLLDEDRFPLPKRLERIVTHVRAEKDPAKRLALLESGLPLIQRTVTMADQEGTPILELMTESTRYKAYDLVLKYGERIDRSDPTKHGAREAPVAVSLLEIKAFRELARKEDALRVAEVTWERVQKNPEIYVDQQAPLIRDLTEIYVHCLYEADFAVYGEKAKAVSAQAAQAVLDRLKRGESRLDQTDTLILIQRHEILKRAGDQNGAWTTMAALLDEYHRTTPDKKVSPYVGWMKKTASEILGTQTTDEGRKAWGARVKALP